MRPWVVLPILLPLLGCGRPAADELRILSIDRTVDQAAAERLAAQLLAKVPELRAERNGLQAKSRGALQLVVRVEHAPEPDYSGPDAAYHRGYYWMYAGVHGPDGILKTHRYLIGRDGGAVLRYDEAGDAFVPVGEPRR